MIHHHHLNIGIQSIFHHRISTTDKMSNTTLNHRIVIYSITWIRTSVQHLKEWMDKCIHTKLWLVLFSKPTRNIIHSHQQHNQTLHQNQKQQPLQSNSNTSTQCTIVWSIFDMGRTASMSTKYSAKTTGRTGKNRVRIATIPRIPWSTYVHHKIYVRMNKNYVMDILALDGSNGDNANVNTKHY